MTRAVGPTCPRCKKPEGACVCDLARPLPSRHEVLVLQHPQESRQPLSSTPLIPLVLERATVAIGLSWPNLKKALGGREGDLTPARWGVLYLGKKGAAPPSGPSGPLPPLAFVDKHGAPAPSAPLDGIVLIDGTWSQARAIWWRNPWLTKLKRLVIAPTRTSRYGDLRLAARAEGLSTLEAAAETLRALGEPAAVPTALEAIFVEFLARWTRTRAV